MADQYDFKWTVASKPGFTVLPQTKESTKTSLVLTGRGSANWGQDLQQNLLKLLENFASPTKPANAVTGQLWFNTTTKTMHVYDESLIASGQDPWSSSIGGGALRSSTAPLNPQPGSQWYGDDNALKIWDGSKWVQLYPPKNTDIQKVAFVTEYNNLAALINKINGAPQGATLAAAFGWNQTGSIIASETVDSLTNQKWINMQTLVSKMCTFLGISSSDIGSYGFMFESGNSIPIGMKAMEANYAALESAISQFSSGTIRFKPVAAALESNSPANGTATRTTSWSGTINHTITATFANKAAMDAYFNSGGLIHISPSLTNGVTSRDTEVKNFLAAIGTVKFSVTGSVDSANRANATGYYDLTTTNKLVFGHSSGTSQFQIYAKLDGTNKVVLQISYISPGTLYGGVGGTLTSRTTLQRPSTAYLNAPAIAFPTVTQTTIA